MIWCIIIFAVYAHGYIVHNIYIYKFTWIYIKEYLDFRYYPTRTGDIIFFHIFLTLSDLSECEGFRYHIITLYDTKYIQIHDIYILISTYATNSYYYIIHDIYMYKFRWIYIIQYQDFRFHTSRTGVEFFSFFSPSFRWMYLDIRVSDIM